MAERHYHRDEAGYLVRCYHVCRSNLTSAKFWFGLTIVNTLEWLPEHALWARVPGFRVIAHFVLGGS